jgi:hypothetical protein
MSAAIAADGHGGNGGDGDAQLFAELEQQLDDAVEPVTQILLFLRSGNPMVQMMIAADWGPENEDILEGVNETMVRIIDLIRERGLDNVPGALVAKFSMMNEILRCIIDPQTDVHIHYSLFQGHDGEDDAWNSDDEYDPFRYGPDEPKTGYTEQEINRHTKRARLSRLKDAFAQPQCTICLDPFSGKDTVRRLNCGHILHAGCAEKWLAANRTCPVCVADIAVKPEKKRAAATSVPRRKRARNRHPPRMRSRRIQGLAPE